MNDTIKNLFTGIEAEKRKQLLKLMQDWNETLPEENKGFGYDGFFPEYYSSIPRVLFMAREPRSSGDLIKITIEDQFNDYYKTYNECKGDHFWRRILCMYHIIRKNGELDENMTSDDIAKLAYDTAKSKDYGFAYMNLSKYSNDSGRRDQHLMRKFFADSKLDRRNFLKEELELLDPDIIITAHLWDRAIPQITMDAYFGIADDLKNKECAEEASLRNYKIKNKTVKLLDLYHFSNKPGFKPDMDFYLKPVSKLLF